MPSTLATIDVWNMALDLVKEAPLATIDDDDNRRDWFTRNYATTRDALLSEHPWNFAIKFGSLAASATAPAFRWSFAYPLPSDYLYLSMPQDGGGFEATPFPYEIVGNDICCDMTGPLKIRYVYRCNEEGLWSALFVEALSAKLAMKIGHWVSGKGTLVQLAQGIYEDALARAKRIDGMQGTFERAYDDDVIAVRGSSDTGGSTVYRTVTIPVVDDITLE